MNYRNHFKSTNVFKLTNLFLLLIISNGLLNASVNFSHLYSPTLVVKTVYRCIESDGCTAENVKLMATVETCANGSTLNWKYLVKDVNSGDVIQYSYNYTPIPAQGVVGDKTVDRLDHRMNPELTIIQALPIGNYKVEWIVLDSLNQPSYGDQYFDIVDNEAPVTDIINKTKVYMPGEVLAKSFDRGYQNNSINSFDNCTNSSDLLFSFSPVLPDLLADQSKWEQQFQKYGMYFYNPETGAISSKSSYDRGKADAWLPEKNSAMRNVNDAFYNTTKIKLALHVWDQFMENDDCNYNNFTVDTVEATAGFVIESHSISGRIYSLFDVNLPDITVTCNDLEKYRDTLTNNTGYYIFNNVGFHNIHLSAYSKKDYREGLSASDILLLRKYLLGLYEFDSPYKLLAADTNGDKNISVADLIQILNVLLGKTDTFSNVSTLGVPVEYKFKNTKEAYKELDEISDYKIKEFYDFVLDVDFWGIKIGDVNMSSNKYKNRNYPIINLDINDIFVKEGENYSIPVYAQDLKHIEGLQLALSLTNLTFLELKSGSIAIDAGNHCFDNNTLKIISYTPSFPENSVNNPLFTLKIRANSSGKLSDMLHINKPALEPEIYIGETAEINTLKLQFREINQNFDLMQNVPNPFTTYTIIPFNLPEEMKYSLVIYDTNGQKFYEFKGNGIKGKNIIYLEQKDIFKFFHQKFSTKILFYKLIAGNNVSVKKMILQ